MPWQKNGTPNTLMVTGDTLSVDDLTAEDTSVLLCHALNSGTIDTNITFDNDTGSNYAIRVASDGGTDSTAVSQSNIATGGDAADGFHVYYTVNMPDQDKLLLGDKVDLSSTGAGTAPSRRVQRGKWANTADQFTSVEFSNAGAGDFVANSNLSVLSDVVPIPETIGGWVELGRTTLGGTSDNITLSGLSDKRYYMYLINEFGTGTSGGNIQLGAGSIDTGSNYAYRLSPNGQSDTTAVNQPHIELRVGFADSLNTLDVGYIANLSGKEKLLQDFRVEQNTAGAANAPGRNEVVGKWANTSNPLDTINDVNDGSGDFSANSEIVVLGWDPDDIHSGNFWEELASADLSGGANPTLSTGTFTAKKYLWVQFYCSLASNGSVIVRFNNDTTTTNYAIRTSTDGAADTTNINRGKWDVWQATNTTNPLFVNMFIINDGSNEALGTYHTVLRDGTGAGNAPQRLEGVGKYVPTTQITEIDVTEFNSVINLNTISQIKVWGSN